MGGEELLHDDDRNIYAIQKNSLTEFPYKGITNTRMNPIKRIYYVRNVGE